MTKRLQSRKWQLIGVS